MFNMRNQIDKIIITAMDRFVWFVLLVVMSHLVTEFTRVTGYARGNRNDVVLINNTLRQPLPVANMIFYPGQEYGLYEPISYSNNNDNNGYNNFPANANGNMNNNNYNNNNNNFNNMQQNAAVLAGAATSNNGATTSTNGAFFSFRPLIDSIFEIPISTLRAVNNLVARLTGSYQHQAPPTGSLKSIDGAAGMGRSLNGDEEGAPLKLGTDNEMQTGTTQGKTLTVRKSLLPEVSA